MISKEVNNYVEQIHRIAKICEIAKKTTTKKQKTKHIHGDFLPLSPTSRHAVASIIFSH